MRERSVLELGDDLFDDRVVAVGGIGVHDGQGRVRGERVMPPRGEQLALPGDRGGGVEPGYPAHHEPAGHLSSLGVGGERGEPRLSDLRLGHPPVLVLVPDGAGVLDRGPRAVIDGRDRFRDSRIHPRGHAELRLGLDDRRDHVLAIVGRVSPHHHLPARPGRPGRGDGVTDQARGTLPGHGVAPAQPRRGDHRRT
nr:hypothetical protein [Arsenicicoccus piscis]